MKVVQLAAQAVVPDLLPSSNAFLWGRHEWAATQGGETERRDGLARPLGEPVCQRRDRWRRLVKQMFGADGLRRSAAGIRGTQGLRHVAHPCNGLLRLCFTSVVVKRPHLSLTRRGI